MTSWPDRLWRRLTGRRDYLDGLREGALVGWAAPSAGAGPVPVQLVAGGVVLAQGLAAQGRADLDAAGLGACGFRFAMDDLRERIAELGGVLVVLRCDGVRRAPIGRIRLDSAPKRPARAPASPTAPAAKRHAALEPALAALRATPDPAPEPAVAGPRPLSRAQRALFAADPALPAPLFAYARFTRDRYRLEAQFDWDAAPEEAAHFLNWYLAGYGPLRAPLRPPLSRAAIDWLNAPQVVGGQRAHLSRATWAFVVGVPHLRQGMDFANPDWLDSVIHWWSVHQARALGAEDCLVPAAYVARLAGVPEGGAGQDWPLSRYLRRFAEEMPGPRADPACATARRALTLAALIRAAECPDTLRYLPAASVAALLAPDDTGETPLGRYLSALEGRPVAMPRARFAACLAARGYDMAARRFTSITAEGHRLQAHALPAPALRRAAPVDVQVIGPLAKASGLGQAARASLAALATTGLSVQAVNFDLDNPAPEIDLPCLTPREAAPARVSLLHLNAESVPLLAAYAPDITEGSHVAAYMFWELTRPAACHALALEMVDEIWMASDYGRAIYAPHFAGPVQVMGLATDLPAPPDRAAARAALCRATGFDPGNFLCLASFDSFSFVQRKNPLALIRAFAEAFPEGGAQLLLKTQNRSRVQDPAQAAIWAEIDAATRGDARFRILDETLPHDRLMTLKAGADAYLSLHRSEGWGFGMIEAMALGVPVLATGYSGNLAYCCETTAWLVPAREVAPAPGDYIFTPEGGLWGDPDPAAAARVLRAMAADPAGRAARAARAQARVRAEFSAQAVGARYAARLGAILRAEGGRARPGRAA